MKDFLTGIDSYLCNKYGIWYSRLILAAQSQQTTEGYFEKHHIIPKSLGGNNAKTNIVKLTARQHYIAHAFLARCIGNKSKHKMVFALNCILKMKTPHQNRYLPSSRLVEAARQQMALTISAQKKGRPNTWTKSTSEAQKESLRKTNRERIWTAEMREHHATKARSRIGATRSQEAKKNLSDGAKNRFSVPHTWINNGIKSTLIKKSEILNYPGWTHGRISIQK